MAENDWGERLKALGQDLVNIETNTIVADGMTGRKMPPYPHALHDIIQKYGEFLTERLKLDLEAFWTAAEAEIETAKTSETGADLRAIAPQFGASPDFGQNVDNGEQSFRILRWAANNVLQFAAESDEGGNRIPEELRPILSRIRRNCDQLKAVAHDLKGVEGGEKYIGVTRAALIREEKSGSSKVPIAAPEDLTRIRKIWDLGTDDIKLQSVVQLDGDIIFRASTSLDPATEGALIEAHRRATDIGLKHWKSMFELLSTLITTVVGKIFSRS